MPQPPRDPASGVAPWTGSRLLVAGLASLAALSAGPRAAHAEPSLEDKILASKYPHGTYAVYFGWHDPADWQFDEHGKAAYPIGLKVQLKWLDWLRLEGDLSYYRRSQTPPVLVDIVTAPNFDALMLATSVQARWRRDGLLRPYVGAGPVFISLGDDFLAYRPDVHAADPGNPDQFAIASWSKLDIGWHASAGLDIAIGRRVMPFVEYRQLFGSLTLKDGDVTIGAFPFDPANLHTLPATPSDDGRPHSRHYDWSGPAVSGGLKVLF